LHVCSYMLVRRNSDGTMRPVTTSEVKGVRRAAGASTPGEARDALPGEETAAEQQAAVALGRETVLASARVLAKLVRGLCHAAPAATLHPSAPALLTARAQRLDCV
jgi:hypothetical protein